MKHRSSHNEQISRSRAEGRNREQEGGCRDQEAALINNDLGTFEKGAFYE